MQATIEESLVCHEICSYLPMSNLDKLRRTSHSFFEACKILMENVNIIGTCGIYTNKDVDVYYLPQSDKVIRHIVFCKEYEFFNEYKISGRRCMIIKSGVDHIIFGKNIGFIKDDYIEIWYHIISQSILDGSVPDSNDEDYLYVDYGTYKMIPKNNVSLWGDRFTCVELHDHSFTDFKHEKYSSHSENGIQVVTSTYEDGVTIEEYLQLLNSRHTNDNSFGSKIKKIKFNERLEFYYI